MIDDVDMCAPAGSPAGWPGSSWFRANRDSCKLAESDRIWPLLALPEGEHTLNGTGEYEFVCHIDFLV